MEISDLAHQRTWISDNVFPDYRSGQNPRNIQVPLDKLWESRLGSHLVGDLKLVLPAQTPGIYEHIRIALDLSWYPGWIALEWFGRDSFVRVATRASPSSGNGEKWISIDLSLADLNRRRIPLGVTPPPRHATKPILDYRNRRPFRFAINPNRIQTKMTTTAKVI